MLFPSDVSSMTESDFGGADEVARPALQAYTTSAQAAVSGKKAAGRKNEGKKRRVAPPPMRRGKKEAEIKFDEDARRDFLTGFRKRKQARIEKGRDKAKQREKDERKLMRTQAREERKKQAAENVKAERIAYGAVASDDEEGEGDEEEEEDEEEQRQSAYNSELHHTTVTIEEFDPNADLDAPTKPIAPVVKKKAKQERSVEALPPSSRRAAKKKQKDAGDISKLISVEEERKNAYVPEALRLQEEEEAQEKLQPGGMDGVEKKRKAAERKPKFHYETKLERAKNKAAIREMNQKRAEKRREENRGKHNARRGGRGGRGGKR